MAASRIWCETVLSLSAIFAVCTFAEAHVRFHCISEVARPVLGVLVGFDVCAGVVEVFENLVEDDVAFLAVAVEDFIVRYIERVLDEVAVAVAAHQQILLISAAQACYSHPVGLDVGIDSRCLEAVDDGCGVTDIFVGCGIAGARRGNAGEFPVGEARCALVIGEGVEVEFTIACTGCIAGEVFQHLIALQLDVVHIVPIDWVICLLSQGVTVVIQKIVARSDSERSGDKGTY